MKAGNIVFSFVWDVFVVPSFVLSVNGFEMEISQKLVGTNQPTIICAARV